jgi:hypothetical protein
MNSYNFPSRNWLIIGIPVVEFFYVGFTRASVPDNLGHEYIIAFALAYLVVALARLPAARDRPATGRGDPHERSGVFLAGLAHSPAGVALRDSAGSRCRRRRRVLRLGRLFLRAWMVADADGARADADGRLGKQAPLVAEAGHGRRHDPRQDVRAAREQPGGEDAARSGPERRPRQARRRRTGF